MGSHPGCKISLFLIGPEIAGNNRTLTGLIAVMCQVSRIQMCPTGKSDVSRTEQRFPLNWIQVTEEAGMDGGKDGQMEGNGTRRNIM